MRLQPRRNTNVLDLIGIFALFFGAAAYPVFAAGWQKIAPGGNTICGKGTRFEFLVKRGTVNKLLIEFQGGGACFDGKTCSSLDWIPAESADANIIFLALEHGLHNSKQVTADWHAVFVPYCTGDGHTGNHTAQYFDQKVHHMGGANARAALAYAFKEFPGVEATLTAGQSAGGVGAYMWAPYIMAQYPGANHAMLADSYAPLFGKTGVNDGIKNWDLPSVFATHIVPALSSKKYLSWFPGWGATLAIDTFRAFPKSRFGVYVSNGDVIESGFYDVEGCGLQGCSWSKAMRTVLPWLRGNCTNAFTYVAKGASHTKTVGNEEYNTVSGGVRLSDWINDLATGSPQPQREVDCQPKCGIL